jgi:hypothetical protein
MPVIVINIDPSSYTPDMLPVQVGFGPVGPFGFGGLPEFPLVIGTGPFDFGLKVNFICPGYPLCGKLAGPCKYTWKTPVYSFDPSLMIPIKIPGIPEFPKKIGPFGASLQFPPRGFRPFKCPNYPRRRAPTP